jgi:hypothetical protein
MKHYRDEAAENTQAIIRHLTPLLDSKEPVVVLRASKAIHHAHTALRWLEKAGAPTQPQQL